MTTMRFSPTLDQLLVESAVRTLLACYSQSADALDAKALTGLFVNDGTLIVAGNRYTGTAAITEWMAKVGASVTVKGRHIVSNLVVTWQAQAPDEASATADMIFVSRTAPEAPLSIIAAGRYQDRFQRTAQGWRFGERTILFG